MEDIIQISIGDDPDLETEISQSLQQAGLDVKAKGKRVRGIIEPIEIIVALSSAGTLTVLYQTIAKIIEKNKDREITIELSGKKIILKGHSLLEERKFLEEFLPLLENRKKKRISG